MKTRRMAQQMSDQHPVRHPTHDAVRLRNDRLVVFQITQFPVRYVMLLEAGVHIIIRFRHVFELTCFLIPLRVGRITWTTENSVERNEDILYVTDEIMAQARKAIPHALPHRGEKVLSFEECILQAGYNRVDHLRQRRAAYGQPYHDPEVFEMALQ